MIASKCILSTFPGNDVSHVPLTKAGGRAAVCGASKTGQESQHGTGDGRCGAWREAECETDPLPPLL